MSRTQHLTTIQLLIAGLKFRLAQDRFNSTLLKTLGHKDENARLDFLQRVKVHRYILTAAEIRRDFLHLSPLPAMTMTGMWNSLKVDDAIAVAIEDSYTDSQGRERVKVEFV